MDDSRRAGAKGDAPPGRLYITLFMVLVLVGCAGGSAEPATGRDLRFREVATEVGLGGYRHGAFRWGLSGDPVAMMGGGLCWIDYDRDGWLDLFVVNSYAEAEAGRWQSEEGGLPTSRLFRNDEGRFIDVSEAAGAALALRGNGCVAADLDRDGWSDLYITTARLNALLWNNGDGTFSEGAAAAGVDIPGWQSAASVGDVNGDGLPDLFMAGYVDTNNRIPDATLGFPNSHLPVQDRLFLNLGSRNGARPAFREVTALVGLEREPLEYGLGALLSDLDRDGDLDLFVANDTNPNRLYENVSLVGGADAVSAGVGFTFREIGAAARVNDANSGMGVAGGDYDEDGRVDLFITNMGAQLHSIYHNESAGAAPRFSDAAARIGVEGIGVGATGWGSSWGDFDADGDLDLLVINGGIPITDPVADAQLPTYYRNLAAEGRPGTLEEATAAVGLTEIGPLLGRGSAVADYDNDGDLDVAVATIGGPLALLQNEGTGAAWLMLDIERAMPGTVVSALLPDGRRLRRELYAGSSYLSSEDPRCHLGLGDATVISELEVRWPDGRRVRYTDVSPNRVLRVARDDPG